MNSMLFRPENFQRSDIDVVWDLADSFAEWFVLEGGEVVIDKQYCEVVQHYQLDDLDFFVGVSVLAGPNDVAVELGVLIDGHPAFEDDACRALLAGVESAINDESIIVEYPVHEDDGLWVIALFGHDECADHASLDRKIAHVVRVARDTHEALH